MKELYPKINFLMKPSNHSWVSYDLKLAWYRDIHWQEIKEEDFKKYKKIKISKTPFSELDRLNDFCKNNWQKWNIIVIMTNVSEFLWE